MLPACTNEFLNTARLTMFAPVVHSAVAFYRLRRNRDLVVAEAVSSQ